jgi:hypothetical protein
MTRQWRIRITGRPKPRPDMTLLVKAVLALGEEMQRTKEKEIADNEAQPDTPPETPDDDRT